MVEHTLEPVSIAQVPMRILLHDPSAPRLRDLIWSRDWDGLVHVDDVAIVEISRHPRPQACGGSGSFCRPREAGSHRQTQRDCLQYVGAYMTSLMHMYRMQVEVPLHSGRAARGTTMNAWGTSTCIGSSKA